MKPHVPIHSAEGVSAPPRDWRLLRRLWPFIRPHRRLLGISLLILPLTSVLHLLQPYLVKLIIDEAIVPRHLQRLFPLAMAVVSFLMLERLALFSQSILLEYSGQRAMHDLRVAIHRHLLSLRIAFFDRTPQGILLTRVTNDVESLSEAFGQGLVAVIGDLLTLVGIIGAMLWLNSRLALVTLALFPLLLGVAVVYRRLIRSVQRQIRHWLAQINATLQEHLNGMSVVQVFGRQGQAIADFDRANLAHRDAYRHSIRYESTFFALMEMLGTLTVALLLWYGGVSIERGAITFGLLVAFIEYTQKLFIPIRDISLRIAVIQQALASAERVFSLLDAREEEIDTPIVRALAEINLSHRGRRGARRTRREEGEYSDVFNRRATLSAGMDRRPDAEVISAGALTIGDPAATDAVVFERVSFAYASDRPVLEEVSFAIPAGKSLAVVGVTGAGKSTLARLLVRLYEASAGAICLHGRDIRGMPLRDLRSRVVVVNQDVFLFSGSVESNISLDDAHISFREIEAAAEAVGLTRLLRLDHPVLERGRNLSAGERQLVAFARALVRSPEVLVLDEATANIDPATEEVVRQGTEELLRRRTAMIIAHRLSTVERADLILVLHRGRVAEKGTHTELIAAGGIYARLRELQMIGP